MPTNRLRIKFSKIALICNKTAVHVPGYTASFQPNYNKFLQRSFGKTNSVKRSFQDSWFTNRAMIKNISVSPDPTLTENFG